MTHNERIADIKRIRDEVSLGVNHFALTEVEGLLAELDRLAEEIKYLWDKCEGHDRNVLTTGLRIAKLERLAEAVRSSAVPKSPIISEALAKCEQENAV